MTKENIQDLVSKMTLEEKCSLLSGKDFWHTKAVERLGIPSVMYSDGPHGLRKQDDKADHLGINQSIKAVCFPAASSTAASFDPEMMTKMGEALGTECQAEDVSVMLGPAVNIKRSPLCGRNFEYLSEDPYLAGKMAAALIKGVQSQHVGTSIKHFAANSMEWRRMSYSCHVDERTLREIYLPAFEMAVKEQQPWTIMCSYNRINGTYSSDNEWLLTKVLRDEWGFKGLVVTDWGAMDDRVQAVKAGCDLEMPSSGGINDKRVEEAVKDGRLSEADVDKCVTRLLEKVFEYTENRQQAVFDYEADTKLAAEVEKQCMVLLKNEDGILPLKKGSRILFVGGFAEKPRFQGGGSSHINCSTIISALQAVGQDAGRYGTVTYEKGFSEAEDKVDAEAAAKAVEAAKAADTVVIFAGLPDSFESEGYDRRHLDLPACQNQLIEQIAAVNPNVVVVLHNGSPVTMPWLDKVKGVLEAYMGGQAVGVAEADVLFGFTNPSGRLPETFPLRIEDTPCYLDFPGNGVDLHYSEGIFVGYRWYASRNMKVLFPFGYGLSYTTFAFKDLKVEKSEGKVMARVTVTNTGDRAGKEVVQLYVSDKTGTVVRPVRELKGFTKVSLEPGESREVSFELNRRSFAYFDEKKGDWKVPTGNYEIQICENAMQPVLTAPLTISDGDAFVEEIDRNTPIGILMRNPQAAQIIGGMLKAAMPGAGGSDKKESGEGSNESEGVLNNEAMKTMMDGMSLRSMQLFSGGKLTDETIEQLLGTLRQLRYD